MTSFVVFVCTHLRGMSWSIYLAARSIRSVLEYIPGGSQYKVSYIHEYTHINTRHKVTYTLVYNYGCYSIRIVLPTLGLGQEYKVTSKRSRSKIRVSGGQ